MRYKYYVGCSKLLREVFRSCVTPEPNEYPQYAAVIGPFRTKRGANFMAQYGQNNPHCQCVADAEHLAKKVK